MDNPSNSANTVIQKFKVVLLGEGCAGKTSLVLRYVENTFNPKHVSTIQASFLTKKLNISGERLELAIWDTAGQERFHALGPIYYRGSHGAVLVYDITDEDSFIRVKNWVKELRKMLGSSVVLCLAGNKTDLEKDRRVSDEDAIQFAQSVGASHFPTSAKTNRGIDELFVDLSKKMLESSHQVKRSESGGRANGSTRSRNLLVVENDHNEAPSAGRKCC